MKDTSEQTSNDHQAESRAVFFDTLAGAITELKGRLQARCERAHPGRAELLRNIIDGAEARAWELSFFPHLFLPDLVEVRIAELASQLASTRSEAAFARAA